MATAQTTTNYGLPIFAGTDKGNWFDFNNGFQSIDAAIKAAADAASAAQVAAQAANTAAQAAQSVATTTNTALTKLSTDIGNWITGQVTNANSSKISEIQLGTVLYNPELQLINLRFKATCTTGISLAYQDAIVNITGTDIPNPTSNRQLLTGLYASYADSSNVYKNINITSRWTTSGQLIIDTNTPLPSDYDNSKQLVLFANMLLCCSGWFD